MHCYTIQDCALLHSITERTVTQYKIVHCHTVQGSALLHSTTQYTLSQPTQFFKLIFNFCFLFCVNVTFYDLHSHVLWFYVIDLTIIFYGIYEYKRV